MLQLFPIRVAEIYLFEGELPNRFTVHIYRERLSISACHCFPFGFEGGMWNLIVFIPNNAYLFIFHAFERGAFFLRKIKNV